MNGGGEMIGNGAVERRASAEHKVNHDVFSFFGTMIFSFTDPGSFPFKLDLCTGTSFSKF